MVNDTIKKEYKQTELGLIPHDWEVAPLGKLCSYQNGTALESYFNSSNGLLVISIGNYSEVGKFVETSSYIDRKYSNELKKFVLRKNDLAMILNDKTAVGTIIGRVLYIDKNEKYIYNQRTMRITAKDEIEPLFLFFQINSTKTHKYIVNLSKPGTQIYVNTNDITELPIVFPKSKLEQAAVATVLSDTDTLIENLEKLITKKKAIKKGTMHQLLTGKKRLPGFNRERENTILGKVANFEHGYGLSKSDLNDSGNRRCIHYGQLFTEYKELVKNIRSKTNINTNNFYSKENDVLMPTSDVTPRGLATASCIRESGVVLGGGILVIRLNPQYDGLYLSYYISQNRNSVLKLVKGSTVFHLYAGDMMNLEITFPEFKEQIAIATILFDMDTEIGNLEKERDKYIMIKQGMMQNLLTGKIRIYANK